MPKFCSECGYKLDTQHKFCPNCGFEIKNSGEELNNKTENLSKTYETDSVEIIICENCGEENPSQNSICQGCGIQLKNVKRVKKEVAFTPQVKKESVQTAKVEKQKEHNKPVKKKETVEVKAKAEGKQLDTKKMMIISGGILIVIIIILLTSGVFDSGVEHNTTQNVNQDNKSGVNLTNIELTNELENKVKANPTDKVSTLQLANLLQDSGFFDRAITYYKKYLEMEPSNADARVDLGTCYYNLNDYPNATKEMEIALRHQPKHQVAHLNLGVVNLTAGNLEAAKEWFQKAVDIDPNSEIGKRAQELLHSH
jgi:cytochrome c-type biogenesis protein CcmH/NrfG